MTDRSKLFHGIAVVIDDEIEDPNASVSKIAKSIVDAGCHVLPLKDLPAQESIENLREVAFVVLDWNLHSPATNEQLTGVSLPADLRQSYEAKNIDFLKSLKATRFAPVFIFTNEPVQSIVESLKSHPGLYDEADSSHILIKAKSDVEVTGVFKVLDDWLEGAPSVFVLKSWEKQYQKAKNELFLDFYTKSTVWPLILWKTFKDDGEPPAAALGELLSGNLASRMSPLECDLEPFMGLWEDDGSDVHRGAVLRVLEGERFLNAERLEKDSIEPGDVFRLDEGGFRINIRPSCDCIARTGSLDDVELYLLKGIELGSEKLNKLWDGEHGLITERDDKAIIFPMHGGMAIEFRFKDLQIKKWSTVKGKRVGRLLPPFLTRLQQRYAAYLQRPGLPRLPTSAVNADGSLPSVETPKTAAVAEVERPDSVRGGCLVPWFFPRRP